MPCIRDAAPRGRFDYFWVCSSDRSGFFDFCCGRVVALVVHIGCFTTRSIWLFLKYFLIDVELSMFAVVVWSLLSTMLRGFLLAVHTGCRLSRQIWLFWGLLFSSKCFFSIVAVVGWSLWSCILTASSRGRFGYFRNTSLSMWIVGFLPWSGGRSGRAYWLLRL